MLRGAAGTASEEARWVGDEIEALQRQGERCREIAILVRAGFQTREFEERFITLGLPYRVIGGPRFYERQEIRDALAYLRLVHQPADDLAFERIINTPRRGIGDRDAAGAARAGAGRSASPLAEAAARLVETDELKPAARKALGDFLDDLARWRGLAQTPAASRARRAWCSTNPAIPRCGRRTNRRTRRAGSKT